MFGVVSWEKKQIRRMSEAGRMYKQSSEALLIISGAFF